MVIVVFAGHRQQYPVHPAVRQCFNKGNLQFMIAMCKVKQDVVALALCDLFNTADNKRKKSFTMSGITTAIILVFVREGRLH